MKSGRHILALCFFGQRKTKYYKLHIIFSILKKKIVKIRKQPKDHQVQNAFI